MQLLSHPVSPSSKGGDQGPKGLGQGTELALETDLAACCWSCCCLYCSRDGWDALLLHSLLLLRDVCQRLKLHKESLLHSLEIASLADSLRGSTAADAGAAAGMFDHDQAQGLAAAALVGLLAGPQDNKSSLKKPPAQAAQQPQPQQPAGGLESEQPQQQQPQQQQGVPGQAASPVSSPRSGASSEWEYVVQQVDLAAALQQAPPQQEDGSTAPRASQVAEVLLM